MAQRYQGQRDIPLNTKGRAQARRNGVVLCELLGAEAASFDFVASPLQRACETMEIMRRELIASDCKAIARIRVWPKSTTAIGKAICWLDLPAIDPAGFAARNADAWDWQPTDGESYRMLSDRVAQWLGEIRRDTIVASHGGVSRVLRGLILQLPFADIPLLEVPQDKVLVLSAGSARWL